MQPLEPIRGKIPFSKAPFLCIVHTYIILPISSGTSLFFTPSPLSQKSTSSASSEASETCQSVSECNSPTAVSTACVSHQSTFLLALLDTQFQTYTHADVQCISFIFSILFYLGSMALKSLWALHDSRSAI